MNQDLAGQVAIVTGGSDGIGLVELLRRLLAKRPGDRVGHADEVARPFVLR